ncbi:MAG: glycosyltransferase [Elusimicrobiota bacterium]
MEKSEIISYFNQSAKTRNYWRKRNWYYHKELERFFSFIIPENSSVLEIGCGTGDLLANLKPKNGTGIDISEQMIKIAKEKYSYLEFYVDDIENLTIDKKFDYLILQDLIGHLSDVWLAFRNLKKVTTSQTRVIITYYNHFWEPIIFFAEKIGLKMKQPYQNWLSIEDIENLLYLNHYEVIKKGYRFLFPIYIPIISNIINKYTAKLPIIKKFCLVGFVIAKEIKQEVQKKDYSVSVIIPCRNEAGNIEPAIERIRSIGKSTEIIFIDGNSTDGTVEKIREMIKKHNDKNIKLIFQGGVFGKADAVWKGFDAAICDILMILDADLTVPPEDLTKFYLALSEGKGEFISGTRLVYPMEKEAMRILNKLGNKMFSLIFTWILEQRIKDTLCGTKALFRNDYLRIKAGRKFFGEFDPFGDFDLLFGAAKLNLKIVEMPVRYKERKYGEIKIRRFLHGWLLLKMCWIGFRKFKLS